MANNTTARTKTDAENMSARDRLWDSLNYTYGEKRAASDKSYDQAYSQADRQALSRGMQRSSYNNQTLANIANQKIQAQNQIYNEQIADYENRLYQIERDEESDRQWQAQFDEGVRQYDTTMAYNKERAAAQDAQWQQSFNYQQERDKVADSQWQKSFDENVRQFNVGQGNTDRQFAYNYVMAMLQNGQMPSADLLAQAGLSEADARRLLAQAAQTTSPSSSPKPPNNNPTGDFNTGVNALVNGYANSSAGLMNNISAYLSRSSSSSSSSSAITVKPSTAKQANKTMTK